MIHAAVKDVDNKDSTEDDQTEVEFVVTKDDTGLPVCSDLESFLCTITLLGSNVFLNKADLDMSMWCIIFA